MRVPGDPLARAWLVLVLLSAASTVLASHRSGAAMAAILAFAGVKARLVLVRYLGLDRADAARRGFDLILILLVALMGLLLAIA